MSTQLTEAGIVSPYEITKLQSNGMFATKMVNHFRNVMEPTTESKPWTDFITENEIDELFCELVEE